MSEQDCRSDFKISQMAVNCSIIHTEIRANRMSPFIPETPCIVPQFFLTYKADSTIILFRKSNVLSLKTVGDPMAKAIG